MARWATLTKIAGTDYSGCRCEIQDAGDFKTDFAGSVDWANDSSVHAQVINRGVRGITFGIKMVSANETSIQATLDAIGVALGANSTFEIEITDGIYDVHVNGIVDLSQEWLTHGKHSEGYYEDLVWRFIAQTAIV